MMLYNCRVRQALGFKTRAINPGVWTEAAVETVADSTKGAAQDIQPIILPHLLYNSPVMSWRVCGLPTIVPDSLCHVVYVNKV